nr:helix-turn-helix transcriptional regulator [Azospirillum canadense]
MRRTLLGLSQGNLGKIIGLTFQQVQKYERGANRISASKLFLLSHILDVPVSFFFDDMPSATANSVIADRIPVSAATDTANTPSAAHEPNPLAKRETLELVRAYYRIADPTVRRRLFDLTTSMAKPSDAPIIAPTP